MDRKGVVPDVVIDLPTNTCEVKYPSTADVKFGNDLTPTHVSWPSEEDSSNRSNVNFSTQIRGSMCNEDVIQEAVQVYEERMNDLAPDNGASESIYELRRKHSTAKFEAVDHFIKNCRFEVNPWRLEKELREKFEKLVESVKKRRKNNMFSGNNQISKTSLATSS